MKQYIDHDNHNYIMIPLVSTTDLSQKQQNSTLIPSVVHSFI